MAKRRKVQTPVGPVDERVSTLCQKLAGFLSQLDLDWPVLIAIGGVTAEGVDATEVINPGRVLDLPKKRGKKSKLLDVITRTCASHMIVAERGALQLARLYRVRQDDIAAAYERLLSARRDEQP
jgi:hypothetical protein